jgi:hypothetical protein
MGWSERERVSSCAPTHEQGGVTKGDGAGAGSHRHSNLAQLVGVTRYWRRNMCPPQAPWRCSRFPTRPRSVTTPSSEPHRSTCSPDARNAQTIHTVTLNSL